MSMMSLYKSDIFSLSLKNVVDYLKTNGWKKADESKSGYLIYMGPVGDSGTPIELPVPEFDKPAITEELLSLVRTLAVIEDRNPYMIVNSILRIDKDILYQRIPSITDNANSVPLLSAESFITSLRDLLNAAACNEEEPQPYYKRSTKSAKSFADKCRFGHTFHGSFGFSIETSLYNTGDQMLITTPDTVPFERRVVERVVRGLQIVQQAVDNNDLQHIMKSFDVGLNANAYDAILKPTESISIHDVEYSVSWSPLVPIKDDLVEALPIRITQDTFEYMSMATGAMRKEVEPTEKTIIGNVVMLRTEGPLVAEKEADNTPKTIGIQYLNEDRRLVEILVTLSSDDYVIASDAHVKWQLVSVHGELVKEGRRWVLKNPKSFQVLG